MQHQLEREKGVEFVCECTGDVALSALYVIIYVNINDIDRKPLLFHAFCL